MLAKIGVKANLLAETKSKFFAKLQGRDVSFYMLGWTPDTYDSWNPLYSLLGTYTKETGRGLFNYGGYSNKRVDALMDQIQSEVDPKKRNAEIADAFKIVKDEVASIPLHQQALAWGIKDNVQLVQLPDNVFVWNWVTVQ